MKVVLAYSGGLDTSCILKWLVEKGYRVIAFIADVGQREDFDLLKRKAYDLGAEKVYIEDLKREFVEDFIFQALKANAVYEGRYLLGTPLARPLIAKKQVEIAIKEGTKILAHGCTGKGNDQVRFEFTWMRFLPDVEIISPWKDEEWLSKFEGRKDLIQYAKSKGIPVKASFEKPYSIDENLMHISYESGLLEDPGAEPCQEMFELTVSPEKAPDRATKVCIEFKEGIPIKVENLTDGTEVKGSLELFTYLNSIGAENGIGRIDMVENRITGMKSRCIYECPAGEILLEAHRDIESITLDREVLHLKELLSPIIAKLIYNGLWYSPEMDFLMAAINQSQKVVSGRVYMKLYKGNVIITGRESTNSLYDKALSSMEEEGGFDQRDAKGFIRVAGLRLKLLGVKHETMALGDR